MIKFEVGKTYFYRFACCYDTVVKCTITKRTAKTITFTEQFSSEPNTRKIYEYDGSENVKIGSYSMAPILCAKRAA